MTDKPEPCPDCDSLELAMARSAYRVVCTLCGEHGPVGKTEAAARRLWNTRKQKEPTAGPRLTPPDGSS